MKVTKLLKLKEIQYIALSIALALSAFGIGKLSELKAQKSPIKVIDPRVVILPKEEMTTSTEPILQSGGGVVGVKSSKKYYFPWCHPVPRLKEGNAVPFQSIEEARAAGYEPAKNCKGLK